MSHQLTHLPRADLIFAASKCARPALPCFWDEESAVYFARRATNLHDLERTGGGLAGLIADRLPKQALEALNMLSMVDLDLALSRQQRLSNRDYVLLIAARDACHHRILSLPCFDDLPETEQYRSYRTLYEVYRITAILYSNAVIFPISARYEWHENLLLQLREVLESPGFSHWLYDPSGIGVWALFVGGIAAYRTQHFEFFKGLLRTVLLAIGLRSYDDTLKILMRFVWSDSACELGAAMVWESLGLDTDLVANENAVSF